MFAKQLLLGFSERYIALCSVERNVTQTFMYAVGRVLEHLLDYRRIPTHCQILECALSGSSAVRTSCRSQRCEYLYANCSIKHANVRLLLLLQGLL